MKKILLSMSALGLLAGSLVGQFSVNVNAWTETGRVQNNTFTANGSAGFTELFGGPDEGKNDSGARASFGSPVTLNTTTNQLQFSFTVGDILATGAGIGSGAGFRVGFGSSTSVVHYQFGYGDPGNRVDARFGGADSNNEYGMGTLFDTGNLPGATALATGNTSDIAVTLTYLSDAGGGNHNYQAVINWDGVTHSSSTFTRETDTWDSIYVLTNRDAINVLDDTYTVSNVQVTAIPEPSTFALLAGMGALGLIFLRQRQRS